MKFREHRGSRAASMETLVELPNDFDALLVHLRKITSPWPTMPPLNAQTVRLLDGYATGEKLVHVQRYGVIGYIEGGKG
jgi:hypothetical protein